VTIANTRLSSEILDVVAPAYRASLVLREAAPESKTRALMAAAAAIRERKTQILSANAGDVHTARQKQMAANMVDRLLLNDARIEAMAKGVEDVAAFSDPVGRELARWKRPNGLEIARVATPIGVIAMIYESRPNVTADAGAICLKSGNAVVLRGGSDAHASNAAIHAAMVDGLRAAGLPEACISFIASTDRDVVGLLLNAFVGMIDLVIPRGGKSLVKRVQDESRVPVLAHLEGICHVYLHERADPEKARAIALNSKMRRTSVCGAAETLLLDRSILTTTGKAVLEDLAKAGCEIRGDEEVCAVFPAAKPAAFDDWNSEYLDAIIAVKTVGGVEDAIQHIYHHGSHHTESIVTEDAVVAERFLAAIDSAILLWNASTQFADGAEFGMGAEIGIGTGKLHARGPVGVEQLTSFKYIVRGNGQIRP
jgi:glutamate-5-semialdehyde dehydrogenase